MGVSQKAFAAGTGFDMRATIVCVPLLLGSELLAATMYVCENAAGFVILRLSAPPVPNASAATRQALSAQEDMTRNPRSNAPGVAVMVMTPRPGTDTL